jgi:hypothetical protein
MCSGWPYLMSIRSADSPFEDGAEAAFFASSPAKSGMGSECRISRVNPAGYGPCRMGLTSRASAFFAAQH